METVMITYTLFVVLVQIGLLYTYRKAELGLKVKWTAINLLGHLTPVFAALWLGLL